MTDIHCHILPNVDDGSSSWEETLDMARCAVSDGIRQVYCTPHMNAETDPLNSLAEHEALLKNVQLRLAGEGIDLHLLSGAEWMLTPDLLDVVIEKGRLGTSRAFLFELSPFIPPVIAESLISDAVRSGLYPIMAHPERHPWLNEKNCDALKKLVGRGCFLQITAGSLANDFGKQARRTGECLVRMFPDAVLLASDAHNMRGRKPLLSKGYDALDTLKPGLADQTEQTLNDILRSE